MRPVVRINGNLRVTFSGVATNFVITNLPLPRTNVSMCIVGVPSGVFSLHGHWMLPSWSSFAYDTPVKVGVRLAISSMIADGCA